MGIACEYEVQQAKEVIAGYAFGSLESFQYDDVTPAFGDLPSAHSVPRWGYRTYDCILPASNPQLDPLDLLVVAGLNGRPGVDSMAALMQVAPSVSEAIAEIPESRM